MRQGICCVGALAFGFAHCAGRLAIVFALSNSGQCVARAHSETEQPPTIATAATEARAADAKITAAEIRQALHDAAAKLIDLQIAVVELGNSGEQQPGQPIPVIFKQIWMHGQSGQALLDQREDIVGDSWWTGFQPVEEALASSNLLSVPGLKLCVDLTRKDIVWADFRGGPRASRSLHTLSGKPQWLGDVFLPLIELDKPWVVRQRTGGQPVVNAVARRPVSAWRVLGDDRLSGIDTVQAEIEQQDTVKIPLKRHEGQLEITPGWLVWFSKKHGLMPVRVEQTVRYGFQGKEYKLARRDDGLYGLVYEASDFAQLGDVWLPRRGRQNTYELAKQGEDSAGQFDFDAFVDKLLADGMLSIKGPIKLSHRREWRILGMTQIDPAMNLWFDPPPGTQVLNLDTNKRFVQDDIVASIKHAAREEAIAALVGKSAPEFPRDATWLNGEPLTWRALRGQVVILDFWADWCGPCRNDLPELSQLHAGREKNGLTIIGVHPPGSELESIRKVMREFDLAYPICIDVANRRDAKNAEGVPFPGDLFAQFAVDGIPHFVVVDAQGVVAASETSRFREALAVAKKLVNATAGPQP